MQKQRIRTVVNVLTVVALLFSTFGAALPQPAMAAPALQEGPTSVTIAGSLQSELGCPGDWQPECATTHMAYDADDDVWQLTANVPAGNWEYKAALNNSWDENYGAGAVPGGDNIPLNLSAETPVKFYYDHKSHWVTSNQNNTIVTAAGDFQSELGCPADWSPDCLRSWMQDIDGDGVYTFSTSAIPAGSYQFKAALHEGWDESYGSGGGPDNIPFTVPAGATVTFSFDSGANLPTVSVQEPQDLAAIAQEPARNPVQDEVFYFVMPDRFENGNTANDTGFIPGDRLDHGFDPTDKGFYHGGDLAGLLDKLDYLDQLGVTAIWMTPMFENRPVQGTGDDVSAGYHGYWITDFTEFDPHFGTAEELRELITQAHSRDIKIFFDIITNHTADIVEYEEGEYTYRNKADFPYRDADGNEFDDRDFINSPDFPPLDVEISFPYTPIVAPEDQSVKVPSWLNDPRYYHNRGNSTFTGESSTYGDFGGLDDLFTEHPQVVSGMVDIYKFWISNYDIDGFRIDTVKHVNAEFWDVFTPAILEHALSEGKPEFYIFGEVYSANPVLLSFYTTQADMPAVLDFRFQSSATSYVLGGGANSLRDFFADDDWFTDEDSNAYMLPTFLGNHDMGRIGFFLGGNNSANDEAVVLARDRMAHALMYFARGAPVVYYGDEQGFTGDGGDKDARQNMFPSQVDSYNDDNLIGTDATTADANFDMDHPLYETFAELAALVEANQGLQTGAQIHRYAADGAGIYAFSRFDRDERVEYVAAFNSAGSEQSATFEVYQANQSFTSLYPAGGAAITSGGDSRLTVTVPGNGFVLYRADAATPAATGTPQVTLTGPQAGEITLGFDMIDGNRVPNRMQIAADLDVDNVYAEVTFAVRETGASEWTPIGVDDNAPYRVFYDASGWPEGSSLDFIAVVNNLNGGYAGAQVSGVLPVYEEDDGGGGDGDHPYGVIHYLRTDGDYGDHTTGDYNDFWGLHVWGDGVNPDDLPEWTSPIPFLGEDDYGRFAWFRLNDSSADVGFIVHRGDAKDGTDADRFFNPNTDGPEIWLRQDDPNFYTSQAAAQGYVTIHYQRADGDYDGWGLHLWGDGIADDAGTEWNTPRPPDGTDDFGLYWNVPIDNANAEVNYIIHRGDEKSPNDDDQSLIPAETPAVWAVDNEGGREGIFTQRGAAECTITLHYHRPGGDYGNFSDPNASFTDFWGLHTWGAADDPGWTTPRRPSGQDMFGIFWNVPLNDCAGDIGYIIHRGDEKDPGPDQMLDTDVWGWEVWQLQGADPERPYVLPTLGGGGGPAPAGDLSKAKAHWVSEDTIVWDVEFDPDLAYRLHYAPEGGIALVDNQVTGGEYITLTHDPAGLPEELAAKFPHLAGFAVFKIAADDLDLVPAILKGQIAVSANATTGDGEAVMDATGVQIPGVLDDLYTYTGALGPIVDRGSVTLRVWAPTARNVKVHLFDSSTSEPARAVLDMTPGEQGVWSVTGNKSWIGRYYLFEVEVYVHSTGQVEHNMVTDPYSLSLAMNSTRSQIVDLNDPRLKPAHWDKLVKPPLAAPEDIVLYELHVRDFSINDASVPEAERGTFAAFNHDDTNGMQHLIRLAQAGLTHVHLLPAFDFATINENEAERQEPTVPDAPPDSTAQREAIEPFRATDGFNWGYDPFHYTVPEGSYSTNPDGVQRIVEFRQMVQSLNQKGLRVVMDVVYNHTNSSGQAEKSVLDRIVPGYYHRLNAEGAVETSTCCQNTATEHNMMEKLMIDSLITWATAYRVDGFRFDLMGHHMKENMVNVRAALDAVDPDIYVYGEGWDFGEVAGNARGVNATQLNMAGTGIGTFSDRLRDAVRGGGPFDGWPDMARNQGYISGIYYDPNHLNSGSDAERAEMLLSADQIRVGLAGNLADYEFVAADGSVKKGSEIDYNGSPAGYTQDPQENIVYVSAHDNETLWDITQYKLPEDTTMAERVQVQTLGLAFTLLAQGVPFVHAGDELLRSKSLDRNSYDSGDWFNRLDFTYQSNNWGVGLPFESNAPDDAMAALLANPALRPSPADIQSSLDAVVHLLEVRRSSPLFRLQTEEEIMARVHFYNTGPDQLPGLIVMGISDKVEGMADLDPVAESIVVLFNTNDEAQTFTAAELGGLEMALRSGMGASYDAATGSFSVPARTVAVFAEESVIEVQIEIYPMAIYGSAGPKVNGPIAVALISDDAFDATTIQPESVRFGPAEAAPNHGRRWVFMDYDRDGDEDVLFFFQARSTGLTCEDTSATLTGLTEDGAFVRGVDELELAGCAVTAAAGNAATPGELWELLLEVVWMPAVIR